MTTQEQEDQAGREELRTQILADRARRHDELRDHYGAEQGWTEPDKLGGFALVTARADNTDSGRTIDAFATFKDAAAHAGDQILDGFTPLDGIFNLDTGEMIELHISTPVVTASEDQGIMQTPPGFRSHALPALATHRLRVTIETDGDVDPDAIGDKIAEEVGDARSVLCGYDRGPTRAEAAQIAESLRAFTYGDDESEPDKDVKVNGLDAENLQRFLAAFPE